MLTVIILTVAGACPSGAFCNTTGRVTNAQLMSAAVLSPTDAWVVGDWGTALHWDGAQWQSMSVGGADERLFDVVAFGPKDVWALGSSAFHFDGSWHRVTPFGSNITAVVQPRPGVVWLLGEKPLVFEAGQTTPLVGPAAALAEGSVTLAATCAPDQVWSLTSTHGGGLVVHAWNGTTVRTLRQPYPSAGARLVCLGEVAWVSAGGSLLSCTAASGCTAVSTAKPVSLVKAPFGPMVSSDGQLLIRRKDEFREVGAISREVNGAAASAVDQVLLYGNDGLLTWFRGTAAAQPQPVRLGHLSSVAATPDGGGWAASGLGLFVWSGSTWALDESFPASKERPAIELASGGGEVWATSDGRAYRLVNRTWRPMSDGSMVIRGLFVRGRDDVFGFGRETLRRWNGTAWSEVAKVKPGFSWTALTGSATTLYALADRPSRDDTDSPDEILVLETGKPARWIDASFWARGIAVVGEELWSTDNRGLLNHLVDGGWVPLENVSGTAIVQTERGALVVGGGRSTAHEWDGKRFVELQLPGGVHAGTSLGSTVWLVGSETALRRQP